MTKGRGSKPGGGGIGECAFGRIGRLDGFTAEPRWWRRHLVKLRTYHTCILSFA